MARQLLLVLVLIGVLDITATRKIRSDEFAQDDLKDRRRLQGRSKQKRPQNPKKSPLSTSSILNEAVKKSGGALNQTNLLLIMFDDLRPQLSNYGFDWMVTPNFDRLAAQSVTFDYAYSQVAVCCPSRNSLITGLRPDTLASYNFQRSYYGHSTFPQQLARSGYNTAAIGKIIHWEEGLGGQWNYHAWNNDWYGYQAFENGIMNSSTLPDKNTPEEHFRDAQFANRAVETMQNLTKEDKYFMLGVGFKLPHLQMHIPHQYMAMYKNKTDNWKMSKRELHFPHSVGDVSWRCCAGPVNFMRDEGALKHNKSVNLGDPNTPFTNNMYTELMLGYAASITFVDKQMGKLLDALDDLALWNNITIVLTADHGMMNGEKGIWEKWTLFDEAVRVPLMIYHPKSPFKGQHYSQPVELIDVFPTVNELLAHPFNRKKAYRGTKDIPLQGKSLAPIVLGEELWRSAVTPEQQARTILANPSNPTTPTLSSNTVAPLKPVQPVHSIGAVSDSSSAVKPFDELPLPRRLQVTGAVPMPVMPLLAHNFAISQTIRCAKMDKIPTKEQLLRLGGSPRVSQGGGGQTKGGQNSNKMSRKRPGWLIWTDCDANKHDPKELALMGYSMRTPDYKYIAYFHFNRTNKYVYTEEQPYQEELYDHKNESTNELTHREVTNLAGRPTYKVVVDTLKAKLAAFIRDQIVFSNKVK